MLRGSVKMSSITIDAERAINLLDALVGGLPENPHKRGGVILEAEYVDPGVFKRCIAIVKAEFARLQVEITRTNDNHAEALEDAKSDAYDDGHSDGYASGSEDGYWDGFNEAEDM